MRAIGSKIVDNLALLQRICRDIRADGKKISMTTGHFDVIHDGHPLYLQEAKRHADFLVVGIDNDLLVKKQKGPKRPYNSQSIRVTVVASFESVDVAIVMHDIHELIAVVEPHILVVSESTKENPLDGRESQVALVRKGGGDILVVPPMSQIHSTSILKKMEAGREQLQFDF